MAAKGKYLDIEELYRSKFESYSVDPDVAVRDVLMKKVSAREFLRFNPARFNVYYLAAAVATVTAAFILTLNAFRQGEDVSGETVPVGARSVEQPLLHESPGIAGEIKESTGKVPVVKPDAVKEKAIATDGKVITDRAEVHQSVSSGNRTETIRGIQPAREVRITSGQDAGISGNNPVSSFAASSLSGCTPFILRLHSTSRNHDSLQWLSGDGRSSAENDIEWTYTEPGTYTVILMVYGRDGKKDQSSADIMVYPLPVARFDANPANIDYNDREVMLYNYSTGMLTSIWEFGDGETSQLREPVHLYKSPGRYRIKLTVSNEYGCTDTVSEVYSTSTGNYEILFPNAFIPNKNGSTGGYYSPRSDEAAFVFHPEYEGVTEYHLIIYSRTGAMLFESRNLNIGWDGYYKGQLCEPGVYIWRARGRYANGEQFMKSGDVTLLRF